MLKTEGLTFKYKQQSHLFNFPNINLKAQENLLILGKSGIGKTTLLHLLAGLLTPTSGQILINGIATNTLSQSKLDAFRGQQIGLVFQKNYAIKTLNVFQNLQARMLFSKKKTDPKSIENLLIALDLNNYKKSKIQILSEGQLQRLGIALATIHKPKLILADEPTSNLDNDNCKIVMELLIKQAKATQANLIVITHDHRIKSYFNKSIVL